MNLPFHKVHDINKGYCRLLPPLGFGYWLALRLSTKKAPPVAFDRNDRPMTNGYQLVRVRIDTFHNCTATGIY